MNQKIGVKKPERKQVLLPSLVGHLMQSPYPEDPMAIGMITESVTISRTDKKRGKEVKTILGEVNSCMGGGIIVRVRRGDGAVFDVGIDPTSLWRSVEEGVVNHILTRGPYPKIKRVKLSRKT